MAASAIQFESARRQSLTRSLCGWISAAIVLMVVALSATSVFTSRGRILAGLQVEGDELARRIAGLVSRDLWNLDVSAISQMLARAPLAKEVAFVRVLNEFHEPLTRYGNEETPAIAATEPVYHSGELIGYIEIGMSTHEAATLQRTLVEYGVALVLGGSLLMTVVVWLTTGVLLRRPLSRLTASLKRIADGDYESRLPASPYMEIDEINGEVNTMAQVIALRTRQLETEVRERRRAEADLRSLAGDLERLVDERTLALTQTNRRLADEVAQRKQAQDEILAISGYEQRRIGQDLHDSLGQELAGGAFLGGSLVRALRKKNDPLAEQASQLTDILSNAVSETRRIAHGLMPVEPANDGLIGALKALCQDASQLFGVDCVLQTEGPAAACDPATATHLYRIAQEAIHNAVRHGHAAHIVVTHRVNAGTGLSTLSVVDDGSGFPASAAASPGLGLRTMRYRADAINGRIDMMITDGGGAMVLVEYGNGISHISGADLARL